MASFATSAITHPGGKFVRLAQGHREIISPEHEIFKPAPNRYHLYISYACPWANRCLAMLKLKGLTHTIGVTSVHPTWKKTKPDNDEDKHCGWAFFDSNNDPPYANTIGFGSFTISGCEPDPHNDAKFIRDLYELSDDKFNKYSVPVLWDIETKRIVNNESSEIIRMFNTQFTAYETGPFAGYDFYPDSLKDTIDEVNAWVYSDINDGVYKCGFSRSQIAYNEAATTLFTALDRVESILSHSRYIAGDVLTEADIRLFMTLVRYDEVYVVYFKCNGRSLLNMPNIRNYMREMYQLSSMNEAIRMDHIKMHYFTSHPTLNPYAIIPMGPDVLADLQKPHDRDETCPKTDGGVK